MSRRKLEILNLIARHRVVRSNFVYALIGGHPQYTKVMLQALRHDGYIHIPPDARDETIFAGKHYYIYALTKKGKLAIATPDEWMPKMNNLWHQLMLSDILMSFELIARKRSLPFKQRSDILSSGLSLNVGQITHPKTGKTYDAPLRPDGLCAIGEQYFVIEVDRHSEPMDRDNFETTSYLRKLLQYEKAFRGKLFTKQWGIPNVKIIHLTISSEHAANIVTFGEGLGQKASSQYFKGIPMLSNHHTTVTPLLTLMDEPWLRMGLDPQTLN